MKKFRTHAFTVTLLFLLLYAVSFNTLVTYSINFFAAGEVSFIEGTTMPRLRKRSGFSLMVRTRCMCPASISSGRILTPSPFSTMEMMVLSSVEENFIFGLTLFISKIR